MQRRKAAEVEKKVKEGVTLRIGTCIDDSPLTITLAGSTNQYTPHALSGLTYVAGDQVAVLVQGNDMLLLGPITP